MDDVGEPKDLFGSTFDFLKVLGASLTGLTAILTAAGFLAERARLAMLGLPSATFDLELYVETGAFFLALLPVVLFVGSALLLVSWISGPLAAILSTFSISELGLILLFFVIAFAIFRWWHPGSEESSEVDRGRIARLIHAGRTWIHRRLHSLRSIRRRYLFRMVLALSIVIQLWSLNKELTVLDIRDVLFETSVVARESFEETEEVTAIVRGSGENNLAMRLFGSIVLSTVINASVFYYVVRRRWSGRRPRWRQAVLVAWTVITALLLVSQITLLPYSYGVLLARNNYPEVCPVLSDAAAPDPLPTSRLSLVHQTGDGYYLYSRAARKLWYLPRSDVQRLVYYSRTDVLDRADPKSCPEEVLP